jgi:hypothetical protein
MQDLAFGINDFTIRQYMFEGVQDALAGVTDDELAASLVDEMVRTGLACRM